MSLGRLVDIDREGAILTARISFETGLAMADSLILTIARTYAATLWTQDADFEGMAGVQFTARAD